MFYPRFAGSRNAPLVAAILGGLCTVLTVQGTSIDIVASGLNNPRGLAFGPEGALYVAEAGLGGNGPSVPGPDGPVAYGSSGSITRIQNGVQTRIVTGLPSLAGTNGYRASGPSDISFQGRGNMFITFSLGGSPEKRALLGADGYLLGRLVRMQPNKKWSEVADLAAYEEAFNPGGRAVDSNPYSVCAGPGMTVVADAGANALIGIRANGAMSTLAVFPPRMVAAPPFLNLPPGTQIPMESVPDSVTRGPDGAYYVGELTGFPFKPGAARVFRVVPGEDPAVAADGFTNIIDLDFGPDGSLYVLQHDNNGLLAPGDTGALIRVRPDGTRSIVVDTGLVNPTSVAIGPDGAAYVSNHGAQALIGEVLRISLN